MPNPNPTPKEQLEALLTQLGPAAAAKLVRDNRVGATRDHFCGGLNIGTDITFTVADWRGINLTIQTGPTTENNPGGEVFQDILLDTNDALIQQDAPRFLKNLILIYKVVRRV